ncbi:unnamed protein product [Peronospora destructor]|uniref:Mannosylglycerate hydrolase MGH1-like glycoside hydrolase domain-containing protein n=1 Tax=Peronospora destructor TaxID=86335 RepID=A0AAV0VE12_9STRA|nr:unnamed protein product [Peronospora destructor]
MHILCAMSTLALSVAASTCDERNLERDAATVLANHMDVELGGIGAGKNNVVGFQYMKPAEALLAAQALAHEDFDQAATQVQRILGYRKSDGLLPHLVYGLSVPSYLQWLPSNRTFHPGPAFWQQISVREDQKKEIVSNSTFDTSTISAPPVAGDVAWEIFRLAPYDLVLGVRTTAVQFLCHVYEPLMTIQKHLFSTRRSSNGLLTVRHPWETFSSLSPHWKGFLANLKKAPDYKTIVRSIPEETRNRFAIGASTMFSAQDAVKNMYEPMIYLAAQTHRRGQSSEIYSRKSTVLEYITYASASDETAQFGVEDVEFNSLMLRSSLGLVNIGRVLVEHSSMCKGFTLTQNELLNDVKELRAMASGLKEALIGTNTTQGLWNTSADFFADSSRMALTTTHSLRGSLPSYAVELDDDKKMRLMKHFLSEPGSFSFFCARFPAVFLACSGDDSAGAAELFDVRSADATWILYNYFVQRGFVRNKFLGLADYLRNKTRDMICKATTPTRPHLSWFPISLTMEEPAPAALAAAYDSRDGAPVAIFDDNYLGSTLAAATLLNILLPAVTLPPSPDTPPIDHRILSVIMCVELVVAFGVAISCFLFSVYFVANRPRHTRLFPGSKASTGAAERDLRDKLDRHGDELEDRGRLSPSGSSWAERYSESSCSDDYSPRSGHAQNELEHALISGVDEHYGSFNEAEQPHTPPSNSAWKAAKNALADISPW